MTDPFEDAIKSAAGQLGQSANSDVPSYHDAWIRGRRRRFAKRSALAAVGALVLVAALSINLGPFGSDPVDVDDVALPAGVSTEVPVGDNAPASTEPAATASMPSVSASVTPAPVVGPAASPAPGATTVTTEPTATVEPLAEAVPAASELPPATATITPSPQPEATSPPEPTSAPVPTTPPTQPSPTPAVEPTIAPTTSVPTNTEPTTATPAPTATTNPAADDPPSPAEADEQQQAETLVVPPAVAATSTGPSAADRFGDQVPDAVFVATTSIESDDAVDEIACDTDGDGASDATCQLLFDRDCVAGEVAPPGYIAVDVDGDGAIDTCQAVDTTVCDTTGDGRADSACIISIVVEPPPSS